MASKKRENRKKLNSRKIVFAACAVLLCAFLLELIQVHTAPEMFRYKPTEEIEQIRTRIYPGDRILALRGYDYDSNAYLTTTSGDPQMVFDTETCGAFSWIYFFFQEETGEETIQVYYDPDAEGEYREEDSIKDTVPAGTAFWAMEIPAGEYGATRIDIDGGTIPLQAITVGNAAPESMTDPNTIHPLRIAVTAVCLAAAWLFLYWTDAWGRFRRMIRKAAAAIRKNKKKSLLNAGLFLAVTGGTVLLFWLLFYVIPGYTITGPQIVFAALVGCFAASMAVFRKTLAFQPEYIFLVLVLCLGFLYTYYMPHNGAHSWDEEFHYQQALNASYVDEIRLTEQDNRTMYAREAAQYDLNGGLQVYQDRQDERNQASRYIIPAFVNIQSASAVFSGAGLFTGRALGLRYYQTHFLGQFFGLIAYALAGFFAIRVLKSGKMIAAVVLLIPTGMFLASSYNYDSYLTVFSMLGLCYYIAQWQNRQAKVTLKDAVIMIGAITFGCVAKPVYLPLLWILLLLPKDKFRDRKYRRYFRWGIAAASLALVISYAAPMFLRGGVDDVRGGTEVSTLGQIKFILKNPLEYAGILWNYLVNDYINPYNAHLRLTLFGFDGLFPNQYIYMALLAVVAFTDKNEYDRPFSERPWRRIWPILVAAGTMILVVTSMYIAFTPVGYGTINGAQYRYLIPLYFPVLFHIGSGLMENKMNRAWYNGVVLSVAAFVEFACVYNAYVSHYF